MISKYTDEYTLFHVFYFFFYVHHALLHQGAIEFNNSFYIAGDNSDMAVKRTVNNVAHIQKRRAEKSR